MRSGLFKQLSNKTFQLYNWEYMNPLSSQVKKQPTDRFQKQKLYVEELSVEGNADAYEKELKAFLSRFGVIIDIKILQNRKLRRATKTLRFCHVRRRHKC